MKRLYFVWFFVLLVSCESTPTTPSQQTFFVGNAMTIDYRIIIGTDLTLKQEKQAEKVIEEVFTEVNNIYNKWNPLSEVSKLNALTCCQTVPLSEQLHSFLHQAAAIVSRSGGLFDPTIEPVQQLWKEKLQQGLQPTAEEIAALAPAIGWNKIHFDNGLFHKDHDATSLDLGGIAKGYCVDLLVESLNKLGFNDVYVEWGGEIRTIGKHPRGRPWAVLIRSLADNDPVHALAHLDLHDQAVATSGDYLQNWTVEAENQRITYFHIIHPHLHHPLKMTNTSVASATVVAPTCMLADGIATAALMFPSLEESEAWLKDVKEQIPSISFWLASREHLY